LWISGDDDMDKIRGEVVFHHFVCNHERVKFLVVIKECIILEFGILKPDPIESHAVDKD
jgi:hypothetical protein